MSLRTRPCATRPCVPDGRQSAPGIICRCGPRRTCVAQTECTVPQPSPGPRQERPDAGRSPGSWVIARCMAFPGLACLSVRPSGCRRPPSVAGLCIALATYSCRDSLGFKERTPLTAFPIKPLSGHRRDLCRPGLQAQPTRGLIRARGVQRKPVIVRTKAPAASLGLALCDQVRRHGRPLQVEGPHRQGASHVAVTISVTVTVPIPAWPRSNSISPVLPASQVLRKRSCAIPVAA